MVSLKLTCMKRLTTMVHLGLFLLCLQTVSCVVYEQVKTCDFCPFSADNRGFVGLAYKNYEVRDAFHI